MKNNDQHIRCSEKPVLKAVVSAGDMQHQALLFGDARELHDCLMNDLEYLGLSIRSAVGLTVAQMQALPNIRFLVLPVGETVWEQLELVSRAFGYSRYRQNKQPVCLVLRSDDRKLNNLVERYLGGLSINVKGIDCPDYTNESLRAALNVVNDALIGTFPVSEGFYARTLVATGALCAVDYQSYALSSTISHKRKVEWWKLFEEVLADFANLYLPLRITIPTSPLFFSKNLDFLRLERLLSKVRLGLQGGFTFQFSAGVSNFDAISKVNFKVLRRLGVETEYAVPHDQLLCFKSLSLSGFDRVVLDTAVFGGHEGNRIAQGLFRMFFASLGEVGIKTAVSGPIDRKLLRKIGTNGCSEYLETDESEFLSLEGLRHLSELNGKMGGKLV